MAVPEERGSLRRTMGVSQATAIGLGTMVGAGIFVFPGLAAGHAGPAAMLSFAIGAIVALLVALPASELATAMPFSGGPAVYVSRTMGPFWGSIVGIGQWMGLLFASAFYLVGFGRYLIDLFERVRWSADTPLDLIAVGGALALTAINLAGTKKASTLQKTIVVTLLAILSFILGYGVLRAVGVIDEPQLPAAFLPFGMKPVFTTAALVFTSYLGFV